jgi:hypothetical protein
MFAFSVEEKSFDDDMLFTSFPVTFSADCLELPGATTNNGLASHSLLMTVAAMEARTNRHDNSSGETTGAFTAFTKVCGASFPGTVHAV